LRSPSRLSICVCVLSGLSILGLRDGSRGAQRDLRWGACINLTDTGSLAVHGVPSAYHAGAAQPWSLACGTYFRPTPDIHFPTPSRGGFGPHRPDSYIIPNPELLKHEIRGDLGADL
jgi:hypothetical protein